MTRALFLSICRLKRTKKLILREAGYVSGSGESGAKFGYSIADLGDIDGDEFRDVAIAAPWENDGVGGVYIYKGSAKGLKSRHSQRVSAEGARGFGISISRGFDVDMNYCNDLAIGAFSSSTAYIYRCIPTMVVHPHIRVPDAMNLPQNTTKFSAIFCVTAPAMAWRRNHPKIRLKATITVDHEDKRASIAGDSEYTVTVGPGKESCDEQQVEVKPTADLSKPISIKFEIEPAKPLIDDSSNFDHEAARLSDDSTLETSFLIQLVRDCGDDLICTPWLVMSMEAYNSIYVPGTKKLLGVKISVFNKEEPAYGAKVIIKLPLPPKRIASLCSLEDLVMTCDIPAPLGRGESINWDVELEDIKDIEAQVLKFEAELKDSLYRTNVSDGKIVETFISIVPKANFSLVGKALPNISLAISREKFYNSKNLTFSHYYEISSSGPSDWKRLNFSINISKNISLINTIKGCRQNGNYFNCTWFVPANATISLLLTLKLDFEEHGSLLEQVQLWNVSTTVTLLLQEHKNFTVTTFLALDPASPIWPIVVGVIAGILLLAAIISGLHKAGFFSRRKRDELKRLQEEHSEVSSSTQPMADLSENIDHHDTDQATDQLLPDNEISAETSNLFFGSKKDEVILDGEPCSSQPLDQSETVEYQPELIHDTDDSSRELICDSD